MDQSGKDSKREKKKTLEHVSDSNTCRKQTLEGSSSTKRISKNSNNESKNFDGNSKKKIAKLMKESQSIFKLDKPQKDLINSVNESKEK